jgi:HlyD family secretion protein
VQIRTLVDETDIGKVRPDLQATITVDAYPNRPFQGAVLKIEPQATVQQNVTMFPVLVRIANPDHLLKPGMNTEVEIHVGERRGVVTVPYAALRTQRDVASAAEVLGLDPQAVQQQLAQARQQPEAGRTDSASMGGGLRGDTALRATTGATADGAKPSATITTPDGRTITIPGVTQQEADQAQAAMRKRMSGGEPTPDEQAVMRKVFNAMRQAGGGGFGRPGGGQGGGPNRRNLDTGSYIVFAIKNGTPTAVPIRTGLTDLDYIEVLNGLSEGDTVVVLPTSGMLSSQREMRERFQRMTGGGLPGVQQAPATPPRQTNPR